jgi:ABC-2 type transport system permease protein
LRLALLWAAIGLPFVVAAAISGAGGRHSRHLVPRACLSVVWTGLSTLIDRLRWSSVANAASLVALWLVLVLVLPTLGHVVINRVIPVDQGAEIALAQREAVNHAWDPA